MTVESIRFHPRRQFRNTAGPVTRRPGALIKTAYPRKGFLAGGAIWAGSRPRRHRVFLTRQKASGEMLARLSAPIAPSEPYPPRHRLSQVLKTAMIVALLGGGWFAYQAVEFHLPASMVEALLPRL